MNEQIKAFRWSLLTTVLYVSFMVVANVYGRSYDIGVVEGFIFIIWLHLPIFTGAIGTMYMIRAWRERTRSSSRWRLYLSPFLLIPILLVLFQLAFTFYIH
jgi:hypothetical protein